MPVELNTADLDSVMESLLNVSAAEIDERIAALEAEKSSINARQGRLRELRKLVKISTAKTPRKRKPKPKDDRPLLEGINRALDESAIADQEIQ